VLVAALPPAANVVTLAKRYHAFGERASVVVLLATVISVATVTLTLILILNEMLPTDPFR
jgi:predicted permease